MSLDRFYAEFARLISDPEAVRRTRRGDLGALDLDGLTEGELSRLKSMAADAGMEVMCSLYRSNRLTALVRTVPSLVLALRDDLSDIVTDFWREHARTDMQFRSEAESFCAYIRRRYPADPTIQRAVDRAEAQLAERYEDATSSRP